MTLQGLARRWRDIAEQRGAMGCIEAIRLDILEAGPEGEQRCVGALRLLHQALLSRALAAELLAIIESGDSDTAGDGLVDTPEIQALRAEESRLRAALERAQERVGDLKALVDEVYALRAEQSGLEREVAELEGMLT